MDSDRECPSFVSGEALRTVFRWEDAIRALQAAYGRPFKDGAVPLRSIAQSDGAWMRALPAAPTGGRYYGAKLMGMNGAGNPPKLDYVIVLFDRETSRLAAFIDANLLTGYRTAATSAAALDKLYRAPRGKLGVIGSGLEATMHTRAFAAVRQLEEVAVFSPNPAKRQAFAEAVARDLGVPTRAAESPEDAVGDADIVLAAARSYGEVPILYADWLKKASAVVSIGSTVLKQREADASVIGHCDFIVCDVLEEVLHETGDMVAATEAGIDVQAKSFSLNAFLCGEADDKFATAKVPMFKSVGSGLQDIVVAEMVLTRAIEAGLAQSLPISFEPKLPY